MLLEINNGILVNLLIMVCIFVYKFELIVDKMF